MTGQTDSLKCQSVFPQGFIKIFPATVALPGGVRGASELRSIFPGKTYLNTIIVDLSARTRDRQVPRTGKMRIMMKMILLKLRMVGNKLLEMTLFL